MSDFSTQIAGHDVEFFEDGHIYLVDGIIVPSITQILQARFKRKYDGVPRDVLDAASRRGVEIHKAIEIYAETGIIPPRNIAPEELYNFLFLMRWYKFEIVGSEVPVLLFVDDEPFAAGRLDLVIKEGDRIGGADIKSTATLDKEYLAYQLNLYRLAYRQSYGVEWEFLRGIHLRGTQRKYAQIPINEYLPNEIIEKYRKGQQ